MQWTVRRVEEEDIQYLSENLREADKAEVFAGSGHTPEQALRESVNHKSLGVWVGVYQGNPEIIFGVAYGIHEGVGHPWMLCTDKLAQSPREFIKACRKWVKGFSLNFPVLMNCVHAKNELHIRWLKWCGFEFVKLHENYGHLQEPFWEFQMIRK